MQDLSVIALTRLPKHHFFGFHDLPAWNYQDDKILSLEVDVINRPPLPYELAGVGYINDSGNFIRLGDTSAFNFPQGSRMQWIGHSNQFIINNIGKSSFICDIYDTDLNKKIDTYDFPCHQIHSELKKVFSINYARLHRLGAYGYSGFNDKTISEPIPSDDGIFLGDFTDKKNRLLISIHDVANYPDKLRHKPYAHHYLTHLLLSPSKERLAFLHRYPLADGGEMTRLMTISIDGKNLRCLAEGFLSHFDWENDETIFIYGRPNSAFDALRANHILTNPVILKAARFGKMIIKDILKIQPSKSIGFVLINDADYGEILRIDNTQLNEDGHPMFNPLDRNLIINDTYPDKYGIRTLMLYDLEKNQRIDLGRFKMTTDKPDYKDKNLFLEGIDNKILEQIGETNLSFNRSGLHCDLHPRWNMRGTKVAFDSIHEGTRQLYYVDLRTLIHNQQ